MTSETELNEIPTNHRDRINVEFHGDTDFGDNVTASHSKWNEILTECENYNLSHYNYDSSTVISDSISGRSSDSCEFENHNKRNLSVIPTSMLDQNMPAGNISVQHSTDILFGNKTVITGPVVIRKFIAESDILNINQKDKHFESSCASEISSNLFVVHFLSLSAK